MQELVQLLVMLAAYYATFGIMAIGFGMMLRGSEGASAAGTFFFLRPVQAIFQWSKSAVTTVLVGLWSNIICVVSRWIAAEVREIARDVRWLVTRERGWVWRR